MPAPKDRAPRSMTIIDLLGVFTVRVRFCGCSCSTGAANEQRTQLLRMRWFPATAAYPHTAVTFRCLDNVCHLNNQGKLTGYDYYQSLMHATDNAELDPPNVRFSAIFSHYLADNTFLRNGMRNSCGSFVSGSIYTCSSEGGLGSFLKASTQQNRAHVLLNVRHALCRRTSLRTVLLTRMNIRLAPTAMTGTLELEKLAIPAIPTTRRSTFLIALNSFR